MNIPRIHQLSKLSRMISQLVHSSSSPFVFHNHKAISRHNPPPILLQIRCFKLKGSSFTARQASGMRNEARGVLCDYLHSTRSIIYTDAEHISRNCPLFLQFLISKIDGHKDVTHSLTRFLSYSPINEFEPFFESLGLTPSQYLPLLPRNTMFLSDDPVLLQNYHSLSTYGIPRIKIGKIFKEAKEIFEYGHGILTTTLQAYESLGLSKPTVIKLVICSPLLLVGGVNSDFANVHEKFKGLGFQNDWIGGYLSASITCDWKRMLDTLNFLDTVGYNEDRMGKLLTTNPALLFEGSGKKIYVLFGRFLKLGFKMHEACSLFLQNAQMLSNNYAQNLLHAVDFLFQIQMGIEDIADIVSAHLQLLGSSSLKRPRTLCKMLNVNKDGLCQVIKEDPLRFFSLASNSKVNSNERQSSIYLEKTTFLLSVGYAENSEEMSKALKVFRGRGDQLQERFDCLVKAGLDYNVVADMVKKSPVVLNQNKEVIEKKIDYLINWLGYPLEYLVAFPLYLGYSIERIHLRFSMYAWLKKKESAVNPMFSLSTILASSDARFVKYVVNAHPEGPAMWKSLKETPVST